LFFVICDDDRHNPFELFNGNPDIANCASPNNYELSADWDCADAILDCYADKSVSAIVFLYQSDGYTKLTEVIHSNLLITE